MATPLGSIPANTDMEVFAATYGGGGGSGVGWFDLSVFTRANIHKDDKLLLGDVSDTTSDPEGTLKQITVPGLAEVQRRLLVNMSATDQTPFSSDTYLGGSSVVIPDTPVVGSMYHCVLRISKTAAGTASPVFNLRIGSGVIGDTSRGILTYGAGTAAADVALVEFWAVFTEIHATTGKVETISSARTNLTTTGWSNGVKNATVTSGNFDNTALAGLTIGLSYNGGASAAHTVSLVRADYNP